MRLKSTFITHNTEGEQMLIDVSSSFAGLIRSNRTAAFIVDCLKEETTEEAIVDAMYEKYDAPRETLERDVQAVLARLRKVGAIEE